MPNSPTAERIRTWSPPQRLSRWWLDRSIRAKGRIVVAVPMLALIAVAGAALALQVQQHGERRVALAASALNGASLPIITDALDAETGIRGYVATADPRFLVPYTAAAARFGADLQKLRTVSRSDNEKAQTAAIAVTVTEIFDRFAQIQTAVLAGSARSATTASLEAGKVIVDRLRTQVADLTAQPTRLMAQKRAAITRLESRIVAVEIAGLAFGMLAGLAGIALFTSGIARRLRLAADNASRLGNGEVLLPATPSADELGQLGDSLSRAHEILVLRLAQVSAARDDAVKATQTKNTFLSRTSHELRTPLHAVLGFAQLLEMSDLNQEDRDSAARILTAGRHLLALINELIDIGRVEAGELTLSVEPVPLHAAIQEIAMLIGPLAEARAITVEQCCTDQALAAFADHQRLRQVMVNLASNAVKYNHHGGMIRLDARPGAGDRIELTVTDTGPGLSADEITRVFQPFERLEAEQHGIEGTGIGLPLALALTEAMHGTLEVTSTKGYGSTFTVRLLRAPDLDPRSLGATTAAEAATPADRHGSNTEPLVVLSIEDNPANSVVLSRLLESWPATTLYAASSGHAGIELACRHDPDLILLDLHLPDLSGEEVFARLRAEAATATIPVVILSADATPGTIRRLLTRGVDAYLTKPLDLRELQTVLHDIAAAKPANRSRQP